MKYVLKPFLSNNTIFYSTLMLTKLVTTFDISDQKIISNRNKYSWPYNYLNEQEYLQPLTLTFTTRFQSRRPKSIRRHQSTARQSS